MKKKNSMNRKVKFLAWQLDKCAKIGIALCEENNLLTFKLCMCRTALSETQEKLESVQKTRDLDRHSYEASIKVMGDKLNSTTAARNKYRFLFWSLVTLYSVLAVARMVITHFYAK